MSARRDTATRRRGGPSIPRTRQAAGGSGPAAGYPGKRLLDLAVLVLVAVPAFALALVCVIAIRCVDGGPALLRQTRVGLRGRPFALYKLRTMAHHADPESETPDPAHITRVGRTLRRFSLDELPQLINVARGEMSLVGPRPNFGHRTERYDQRQRDRLLALPGITGLAQTRGRNRLGWDERTELDLHYVATQTLRRDLAILARSVRVVLVGDGVDGHSGEAGPHAEPIWMPAVAGAVTCADSGDS